VKIEFDENDIGNAFTIRQYDDMLSEFNQGPYNSIFGPDGDYFTNDMKEMSGKKIRISEKNINLEMGKAIHNMKYISYWMTEEYKKQK